MTGSEHAAAVSALVAAVRELLDYPLPEWGGKPVRWLAEQSAAYGNTVTVVPTGPLCDLRDALARVEASGAKEEAG